MQKKNVYLFYYFYPYGCVKLYYISKSGEVCAVNLTHTSSGQHAGTNSSSEGSVLVKGNDRSIYNSSHVSVWFRRKPDNSQETNANMERTGKVPDTALQAAVAIIRSTCHVLLWVDKLNFHFSFLRKKLNKREEKLTEQTERQREGKTKEKKNQTETHMTEWR